MSKYTVTVVGHPPLDIELPRVLKFSAPATPDQARQAIAYEVQKVCLPHLHDVPLTKQITRNEQGQLAAIIEHPATSRESLAAAVGWALSREILDVET